MFLGPFPTSAAIERIRTRVPAAQLVGTAADIATALRQQPTAMPAIYVLVEEVPRPTQWATGVFDQSFEVTLQCILMVRNATDQHSGAGAREAMDALIAELRKCLLGWVPEHMDIAVQAGRGRDLRYDASRLVSQHDFKTEYSIQVESEEE